MKQVPKFIAWFNDCFRLFDQIGNAPDVSYYHNLRQARDEGM